MSDLDAKPKADGAADVGASDSAGDDRIGHLLWETSARTRMFAEPVLGDSHLSLAAIGVLERIDRLPGITASELARQALKTQQAISQVTSRLEGLGYIERRLGLGRGVGLHLTGAGKTALADGLAREAELDQRLEALLGAHRTDDLRVLLKSLRAALVESTEDVEPRTSRGDGGQPTS